MKTLRTRRVQALSLLFPRLLLWLLLWLLPFLVPACAEPDPIAEDPDVPAGADKLVDPGSGPWEMLPDAKVAEVCGLDPTLLAAADKKLDRAWAVVRHGRLCHEFYPDGKPDTMGAAWSATKTLGALTVGMVAYRTKDLPRTGRRTGPLSDLDRVDHWLDSFSFNKEAKVAHVLAMVAHNKNLAYGEKRFSYDALGTAQINRLSDIMNAAIKQDAQRLGGDVEGFVQKFLFGPLGMRSSVWSDRKPDKILAHSWMTNVRDMARVGLLLLNGGRWGGEQLLSADWIYRMSHPAFEDASTGYGYLTWLNSASNGTDLTGNKQQGAKDPCAPVALHRKYPHPPSEATDCGYTAPATCEQELDTGIFWASGLGGQYIIVHRALDMVLVIKDLGDNGGVDDVWSAVRPALLAHDPMYKNDEKGLCSAYSAGKYAPDLRR